MSGKQKKKLTKGFFVAAVSSDECKTCTLEVRCAGESQKIEELRSLAEEACQLVLNEPDILYLDRKSVPWEEVREQERSIVAEVASQFSDYNKREEQVQAAMSRWYGRVCLMERNLGEYVNFGLRLDRLNKEKSIEAEFASLFVGRI